ncbi:hypothetical protein PanWU01x14_066460 [Parasponia andersonii]|uniref:Uncharacterized protein n=1 Tax=Parasponia andersonii TaxID=3476 RepID=A0A2P5DG37_PARAD|nr:hypothetical protein PanWU01x14_066460 [Parasponia andersonii]
MLLSPSPLRRSKTCLANQLEMVDELVEPFGSRWRCKSGTSQLDLLGFTSPRNARSSRRQPEMEVREEKDLGLVEDIGKPRKRHHIV